MEGKVARQIWMCDRESLVAVARVDSLYAAVESYDEIVEVETQSKTIRSRNLLVELVKPEFTARLVVVLADSPDVSGIDKYRAVHL